MLCSSRRERGEEHAARILVDFFSVLLVLPASRGGVDCAGFAAAKEKAEKRDQLLDNVRTNY